MIQCLVDYPLRNSAFGDCYACDGTNKRTIFGTNETGTHREFCYLIYCPDGTQRETGYYITGRCLKKK